MSTPANALNISATGLVKFDGTATFSGVTVTQHDLLVGAASNGITSVTPSTAQNILVSNGTSVDPSFKSLSVVTRIITSTGTYTPTSGMVYCLIECIGGGGAGGGAAATGASTVSISSGGGAGEYARGAFSASTIGVSQSVTIGASGTANSGSSGGVGGTTSVGSTLISAVGGSGGVTSGPATNANSPGSSGGTGGTGGDFRSPGFSGGSASAFLTPTFVQGGMGANSQYGSGGTGGTAGNAAGGAAGGYGAGGGGGSNYTNVAATLGGAAVKGVVIITEYVIS